MKTMAITNNPLVRDKVSNIALDYKSISYIDILKCVRDKIHLGHQLLSHPLSGSIKPGQTPYKTIIISSEKSQLDTDGLRIIEDSIATAIKLIGNQNTTNWTENVLSDFQLIDYDLIFK